MPHSSLNRRTFLSASALALCVPSRLVADENPDELALRFVAVSDVHFDKSHNDESAERVRLVKTLKKAKVFCFLQPCDRFDAFLVAGDFSNHGVPEELNPFKKILDENLAPSVRRVLAMGNHEYYGGNRKLWEETFQTRANRRQEINGYQFITISPEKGTCDENDYVYLREWLDENLEKAVQADPTKPVFVVQHYCVRDAVYGSQDKPGDFHAGVSDLADILAKYPQIVHISGHSHIPSVDPRAIWQGPFACYGTGSLSYFALGLYERERDFQLGDVPFREAGTFSIFDVYKDNTIRIRLYDVISDSLLDREYLLVDPLDLNKRVHTDARFNAASAPTWSPSASVEVLEIRASAASLRFSQAKDEFCVVSYRVVVEKETDDGWKEVATRYFWSDYFMKNPADSIRATLRELESSAKFRAKIYATGAFQKETAEPLVVEFETLAPVDEAARSNPNPRGNFLDVLFDPEKGPIDVSGSRPAVEFKKIGAPQIVDLPDMGVAASFNGVDQTFIAPFSEARECDFGNEISIFVNFKLDLSLKKDSELISIFGSTESGGLGFEYYVGQKSLKVRYWVDSDYRFLEVPFDSQEPTKAAFTFDGERARLYLDGKLAAEAEAKGKFRFTKNAAARAFCVGGDVNPGLTSRFFFPGRIANARVYTWALTPEQVANVSR
ncbi:MAG: metallophosphoesterase [Thermoguttaceae bacterium]|nr:metallophosphoesterase [Thermoguttaceae bacterium]